MARLSRSDQQSSATSCPPERRGPRNVERRQDLRPMHDSRNLDAKKRGLPGKIRALCIRNRPIAPRNGYMGRRSCQLQREKHAFRANAAREAPFFVQSAKRGYMARESCHSSQSNLEDRHNKSIGRQSANQKKILEQQPNRPTPRRHPQDHCSGSPKQRSNQPVTKTIPARAPILAA